MPMGISKKEKMSVFALVPSLLDEIGYDALAKVFEIGLQANHNKIRLILSSTSVYPVFCF